jgi:asparagine synthase (glutamine-hydrolysing)
LSFALDGRQKRDRILHPRLTERLVPEWAGVPYVSGWTGASTAARIHHGDGPHVIAGLIDTVHGPITRLLRRDAVERALATVTDDDAKSQRILQHFAYLAVASQQLEPEHTGPRPTTLAGTVRSRVVPRLRWIRRTAAGRRVWDACRSRWDHLGR